MTIVGTKTFCYHGISCCCAGVLPDVSLGRKLLFHKQTLTRWVTDGADLAQDGAYLSLEQMINSGKVRIASKCG